MTRPLVAPVAVAAAAAAALAVTVAQPVLQETQTTATARASLVPAASVLTGPSALTALLATIKPILLAPATRPLVDPAPVVLLEAPTTATVLTLLAPAVLVLDTLSAQMVLLATTLLTQPPLALTVPLEPAQDLVPALVVLDLA